MVSPNMCTIRKIHLHLVIMVDVYLFKSWYLQYNYCICDMCENVCNIILLHIVVIILPNPKVTLAHDIVFLYFHVTLETYFHMA